MKRRDLLIISAALPIAVSFPSWASAKAQEIPGRPILAESANFQRRVTVLGTSNPDWRSAYVVDLYRRSKTLYDAQQASNWFGEGPSVAFGNKAFYDALKQARPEPYFILHFYVFDMTTNPTLKDREGAAMAALRCSSPLVMLEDLDRTDRLVPSELLPKLFMSGTHVAGGLVASTAERLFEKIASSLGVDGGGDDAEMPTVSLRGAGPLVQVFFDGRDVTDDYIAWLDASSIRTV